MTRGLNDSDGAGQREQANQTMPNEDKARFNWPGYLAPERNSVRLLLDDTGKAERVGEKVEANGE